MTPMCLWCYWKICMIIISSKNTRRDSVFTTWISDVLGTFMQLVVLLVTHLCLVTCSCAALSCSRLSSPRAACSCSLLLSTCSWSWMLRLRSCWFCSLMFACSQLSCRILVSSLGQRQVLLIHSLNWKSSEITVELFGHLPLSVWSVYSPNLAPASAAPLQVVALSASL